jgi:hypothetical protein
LGEKDAGPFEVGNSNAGAALLIKGEGISLGSFLKPKAKKTTKPKNRNNGIKNFFRPMTSLQNTFLQAIDQQTTQRDALHLFQFSDLLH